MPKPLTRLVGIQNSLHVTVAQAPRLDNAHHGFCHSGLKPAYPYVEEKGSEELKDQGLLPQGLEALDCMVRITGCSRIFTHQLVRMRVGVVFSQQMTGEVDHRHSEILVPDCIQPGTDEWFTYKNAVLAMKMGYVNLVDVVGLSLQDARYMLPHGLSTFIWMKTNVAALIQLYKKRVCEMGNTWEMVLFAERLRKAVVNETPQLEPFFTSPCASRCWFEKAVNSPQSNATLLYDPKCFSTDKKSWYGKTHEEMSSGKYYPAQYYEGYKEIDEKEYFEKLSQARS